MFHYFVGSVVILFIAFYSLKTLSTRQKKDRNAHIATIIFAILIGICLLYWMTPTPPTLAEDSMLSQISPDELIQVGPPPF